MLIGVTPRSGTYTYLTPNSRREYISMGVTVSAPSSLEHWCTVQEARSAKHSRGLHLLLMLTIAYSDVWYIDVYT
jgi:hypothetical protein